MRKRSTTQTFKSGDSLYKSAPVSFQPTPDCELPGTVARVVSRRGCVEHFECFIQRFHTEALRRSINSTEFGFDFAQRDPLG